MQAFTDIAQYMPHGMCLLWKPWLVLLWAGSDALIFASYSLIPLALLRVLAKREDVPHRGLVILFASFILLCGLTHLMGIITLWYPIYPYVGLLKLATGIVSAVTAVVLFRLIPVLIAFPSPKAMARANDELRAEIAAHEATSAELRHARDGLEIEVAKRTEELEQLNGRMAVFAREAVHRSRNLLSVVSALARQSGKGVPDTEEFLERFLGRLDALTSATSSVLEGANKTSQTLDAIVSEQLANLLSLHAGAVGISGPTVRVGPDAAQQIGLVLHELVTNAQKHGMTQGATNSLQVRWSIEPGAGGGEEEERQLVLVWREKIAPDSDLLQPAPGREGFGTRLLTRIVPAMLGGSAAREIDGDRFVYRLTVPLQQGMAGSDGADDCGFLMRAVDARYGT